MYNKEKVEEFRKEVRESQNSWLTPRVHAIFNFGALLCLCVFLFYQVSDLNPWELLALPATLVLGNLTIYLIHRFPLHIKYKVIDKETFHPHSVVHHHFYTKDNYQVNNPIDAHSIFFPPSVIMIFTFVIIPVLYLILNLVLPHNILFLTLGMGAMYFVLYETVHFASHLPEGHWALKIPHFKRMKAYHKTHHNLSLMTEYNFNIVFPLFDYVFGTYKKVDKD